VPAGLGHDDLDDKPVPTLVVSAAGLMGQISKCWSDKKSLSAMEKPSGMGRAADLRGGSTVSGSSSEEE